MELFRESIGTCFLGLFSKFYDKELYRESSGDACSQDTKKKHVLAIQ